MQAPLRHAWYAPDGHPIDVLEADALLSPENSAQLRVRRTRLYRSGYPIAVETFFLVLDHCRQDGPPVLWETMLVVCGKRDVTVDTWRYTSREAAIRNHRTIVAAYRDEKRERDQRERTRAVFKTLINPLLRTAGRNRWVGRRPYKPSKHAY